MKKIIGMGKFVFYSFLSENNLLAYHLCFPQNIFPVFFVAIGELHIHYNWCKGFVQNNMLIIIFFFVSANNTLVHFIIPADA